MNPLKNLENHYIGFDRDGTLESPIHFFPSGLAAQIQALRARGAKTFIASGRSVAELIEITETHQLKFDLICGENGADIIDPKREFTLIYPDLDAFKASVDAIFLPPHVKDDKKIIWTSYFNEHLPEAEKILSDFIQKNKWNLKIYAHPNYDGAIDVLPKEINKTNVLRYIPENTIITYFGDSENDMEMMLSQRVQPHTMDNAIDEIKKIVKKRGGMVSKAAAGLGVSDILAEIFGVN